MTPQEIEDESKELFGVEVVEGNGIFSIIKGQAPLKDLDPELVDGLGELIVKCGEMSETVPESEIAKVKIMILTLKDIVEREKEREENGFE
jgi:hypothetical protein